MTRNSSFMVLSVYCLGKTCSALLFFRPKNGVGLWTRWTLYAKVGHESSESRFDVQLCGGAFGTDALAVFSGEVLSCGKS